ncbi:MAG: hypothetical protein M3Y45_07745 [Actinomycetota bacterium]|nr:hypothetical protein [Actinomycetota bacterium]
MADRKQRRTQDSYPDYEVLDPEEIDEGPDVMLVVPVVKVDEIDLEVDDLRAGVSVRAELRDLVKLNVGVAARLGEAKLNIQGVEAQALLKARLDNVSRIMGRVLTTLDRNPELLESVGKSIEQIGSGAHEALGGTGELAGEAGRGAGDAVKGISRGTRQAGLG